MQQWLLIDAAKHAAFFLIRLLAGLSAAVPAAEAGGVFLVVFRSCSLLLEHAAIVFFNGLLIAHFQARERLRGARAPFCNARRGFSLPWLFPLTVRGCKCNSENTLRKCRPPPPPAHTLALTLRPRTRLCEQR